MLLIALPVSCCDCVAPVYELSRRMVQFLQALYARSNFNIFFFIEGGNFFICNFKLISSLQITRLFELQVGKPVFLQNRFCSIILSLTYCIKCYIHVLYFWHSFSYPLCNALLFKYLWGTSLLSVHFF